MCDGRAEEPASTYAELANGYWANDMGSSVYECHHNTGRGRRSRMCALAPSSKRHSVEILACTYRFSPRFEMRSCSSGNASTEQRADYEFGGWYQVRNPLPVPSVPRGCRRRKRALIILDSMAI